MPDISCPSCGAQVPLRSAALPYVVCPYCQSVVSRQGAELREIGKAAVLPFDVSPIQLGATGEADGVPFEVIGRVRWGWADGSWNEWLLAARDGSVRWLGEAMGQFQLLTERPEAMEAFLLKGFAEGQDLANGDQARIGATSYVASDIKQAACLGGEGDLPFPTPADWTMTSVDFKSEDGKSLSVQRDSQGTSAYEGRYVELAELKPKNLRAIDGWAMPEALK